MKWKKFIAKTIALDAKINNDKHNKLWLFVLTCIYNIRVFIIKSKFKNKSFDYEYD